MSIEDKSDLINISNKKPEKEGDNNGLENLINDLNFLDGLKNLADAVNNVGKARDRYGDIFTKISPMDKQAIVEVYGSPELSPLIKLRDRLKMNK